MLGDQAGQVGGRPEGPPVDLGQAEGGVVGGHHDVGVAHQADPPAQAEPCDGGDDRDLAVVDGGEGGGAAPVDPHQGLVPLGLDLLDVHAGAEAAPLGPQHHHPVSSDRPGGQQRVGQLEPGGHVEGVHRGVVENDLGDTGVLLTTSMGMGCRVLLGHVP